MPIKKVTLSMIGKRFGRLFVLELDHINHNGAYFLCKCDCGNTKVVLGSNLRQGLTTSCGCRKYERRTEDLTGKRFGRLRVIDFDHMGNKGI